MNKESRRVITYSDDKCTYEESYSTIHKEDDQIIKFIRYLGSIAFYLGCTLILATATVKLILIVSAVPTTNEVKPND